VGQDKIVCRLKFEVPITDNLTELMFSGISSYHANRTLRIPQGQEGKIIGETVNDNPGNEKTVNLIRRI